MLRYAAAAATALMLLTGVSACGGQDPPVAKPRPTRTAASPAPSPSPTPPALPAAARGTGDVAVKSFAKHYVELINFATRTGRVAELRGASSRACESCNFIISRVHRIYQRGGSIESNGWRLLGTVVVPNQPLARRYINLKIRQTPQIVTDHKDAQPKRYRGGTQFFTMLLANRHGTWLVTRLDLSR